MEPSSLRVQSREGRYRTSLQELWEVHLPCRHLLQYVSFQSEAAEKDLMTTNVMCGSYLWLVDRESSKWGCVTQPCSLVSTKM